ncbi:MAG: hypothetical protein U0Z17_09670 [Bacteroidales bacterium]
MKLFTTTIFFFMSVALFAQPIPESFTLADVAYPVLGMKKSPSSKFLFLSLAGGRFLLYDISKGKLDENSRPLWKNFESKGFAIGGDAEFSNDEKYILVTEQNAMYAHDKVKIEPFRINVFDVSNGKLVFDTDGVNSAQFLNDNASVLIADDEGVVTYNFISNTKGEKKKIEACEIACLNHNENLLSVSYDAERDEFKKAEGAGLNKKELKNAAKNKKLVRFYEYPSMKKIGTISEEVDVVFRMQYTSDDRYLLFFSRTRQMEHTHTNLLNGLDNTRDLNQFQRIDMNNFRVDNTNFIYQTSEEMANFDISPSSALFAYNDNRGFFAGKREVYVTSFAKQQLIAGKFTFQGRAKTRNLYQAALAFIDESTILVANGLKLTYWNFTELPDYVEFIEPVNENLILDAAIGQLDSDLQNPESSLSKSISKHQIAGLFLLNITIQKNGEVISIFAQSDDKTNIPMQNMLKDIILKYRFDVTVPKNERLKFTYTFIL